MVTGKELLCIAQKKAARPRRGGGKRKHFVGHSAWGKKGVIIERREKKIPCEPSSKEKKKNILSVPVGKGPGSNNHY